MKMTDATPPYETWEMGTPRDYTPDVYRVYFEVADPHGKAHQLISDVIGDHHLHQIITLDHGYEVEVPIQVVPDIVRKLVKKNIAVYQIVRYAKTKATWKNLGHE